MTFIGDFEDQKTKERLLEVIATGEAAELDTSDPKALQQFLIDSGYHGKIQKGKVKNRWQVLPESPSINP